ncbi:uncharacterized protein At2g33490-like [Cucurbita pepo subsp. pepo]|uniref:uncharacterized protein At2g33490-like n=1 Tax=Cucurbita pepo subsp. pepo TaxID=3664 RepID=UPI000C9D3A0F|nr:uncharacterized protein At2g33490-like [Cucurbita pepo subsp. pepo]XP_023514426.1 uncharacterized protein At2g33490-like [Cucurbita pepo subsp. pepo]
MKTSLRKLTGFGLHKHEPKGRVDPRPLAQLDELAQAARDMEEMRDCYDSLLSAAAATENSAYEFSVSLQEMGACLLEKTALNDDEDSGKVLIMLGKVQFELQKLVDRYRSHISQTITRPSESLLNQLRTVEEMKRQCDEKREVYEYMRLRHKEKGRSKTVKGESFTLQQLQTAREEYDDEATLFVFRLKSLKQGQSHSLLTQAARHHATQLCFFKKALQSLEAVEPHVKSLTEQQHIDYRFSGLEDDSVDDGNNDGVDDDDGYDDGDDGELSFDYGQNDHDQDTLRNSKVDQSDLAFHHVEAVKENLDRNRRNSFSFGGRTVSQSAPLFPDKKFDAAERIRQMRLSSTRQFHTYVLPTPADTNGSISGGPANPVSNTTQTISQQNLWRHSSPLEPRKYSKLVGDENMSGHAAAKAQSVLKESNTNASSTQLPPPLSDGLLQHSLAAASDAKNFKRLAFSGPLMGKPSTNKPVTIKNPQLFSGPLLRNPIPQPLSSSPKVSPVASPTFISSPKINELHELPRPPISSTYKSSRPSSLVGHSAPLVSKSQGLSTATKTVVRSTASPLPMPPLQTITRSFSIPSRSPRETETLFHEPKPLETVRSSEMAPDSSSPPLTPLTFSNNRSHTSTGSENGPAS